TEISGNDIDEDCDGVAVMDGDGDGFLPGPDEDPSDDDCDDSDPEVHPGAVERCNGIDDDCDGQTDEDFKDAGYTDADADGWLGGGAGLCPDCNDNDPAVNPSAGETAGDQTDNDCDGLTDEVDLDGDGYETTPAAPFPEKQDCCDAGTEDFPGCNAANAPQMHPDAEEISSDGIDQDCNGADLIDADGDGHVASQAGGDDCDDYDPETFPGHDEVCTDSADNDCDGTINEDCGPGTGEEILIPEGAFNMGLDGSAFGDQQPAHLVNLSSFAIDKYEVTVAEYRRCVVHGPCNTNGLAVATDIDENYWTDQRRGLHPAIGVNYQQALTYCHWVGKSLPTEAQWEKAARGAGNTTQRYPWGDVETTVNPEGTEVRKPVDCSLSNHIDLWTGQPCVGDTEPVNSHPDGVSPFGLYNVAGNAAEWVSDWYSPNYYAVSPSDDPPGPSTGSYRVARGGSFLSIDMEIEVVYRDAFQPSRHLSTLGFRCARTLP
ncbi:MAG: hypothetical protein D6806_18240, partial [Deltaproteobacteria bacterium]